MPSRSEPSPGRRRAVRSDALFNREKILTAAADTLAARGLAPELAERGIAINAIAPGGTATDMAAEHAASYTPPALRDVAPAKVIESMNALGRLAEPDEIAAVAAFLLSSDASYLTGSTVDAAGGWM